MKSDEKKRIEDNLMKTEILDYLKKHASTKDWMDMCEKESEMDIPMMVVVAVMDLLNENEFATQNALQDKFDEGYTKRMEDEKIIDSQTSL